MAADLHTALWLTPKPGSPLHDALKQTIDGLKPLFQDGHKFDPHVTLTSGISVARQSDVDRVLDGAHAAAKSVPYIDVILQQLSFGKHFFRKVVLEIEPQQALVSLATICRERYVCFPGIANQLRNYEAMSEHEQSAIQDQAGAQAETWAANEFKPHLSLVYSNTYEVTEAARQTIDQRLKDVFGPNYATKGIGWTNGRISLVNCEGPVEEWRVLGYRDL